MNAKNKLLPLVTPGEMLVEAAIRLLRSVASQKAPPSGAEATATEPAPPRKD